MKVLAIIGSPRKKGNTWKVVEKVKAHLLAMNPDIDLRRCSFLNAIFRCVRVALRVFREAKKNVR